MATTNEEIVIKAAMSILGSRTSAAKKRSSRLNGAKRKSRLFTLEWPNTAWTPETYRLLAPDDKPAIASRLVNLALKQQGSHQKKLCPTCRRCGGSPGFNRVIAHHPDYDKPMEVEFMCATCHTNLHRGTSNPNTKLGKPPKIKFKRKVAQANR